MYGFDTNSSKPHHFQSSVPKVLNDTALLYFQLDGLNDTVRYVWSLVGTPTLFMSVTPAQEDGKNCSQSVHDSFDWEDFVENQIAGSAFIPGYKGDFAFSVIFNSLIEFKDSKYKANKAFNGCDIIHNNDTYRSTNLSSLTWTFNYENMELVATDQDQNATEKNPFEWTIQVRNFISPFAIMLVPHACLLLLSFIYTTRVVIFLPVYKFFFTSNKA